MYCGYINFLIVLIFVVLLFITLFLLLLITILFIGQRVYIFSLKFFFLQIFSEFEILFNLWRLLFLLIVLIIRTRVLFFSCSYISVYNIQNFLLLYGIFIVRIGWLILNNNFYWMIFGWDGLGVVSFLLIVFYINYERVSNGLFTIFQNRLGDVFFVLFLIGLLDLSIWSHLVLNWGVLFLIFGARVKRAQFPFNTWLLAAISAPTPISSLVHSSTLVVAGVYILLQFSYCLIDCLLYLKWLRLVTLFIRLFGLINETDMKKLIAFSTMNHVALIIFILRLELFKVTYFHLNIHAIFKSLIFMCFGLVMLASYHRQDKRLVRLLYVNPLIKIIYNFSCLCLIGLPFLTGFFSKDFIIEKSIEIRSEIREIFFLIFFLGVRIYYSLKLLQLNSVIFSYFFIEKQWLGVFRIFLIVVVRVSFVNVYISLIFSVRLELFSLKIFIYLFIFIFILLNWLTNLNYKILGYDKFKNWYEIWLLDLFKSEQVVYWRLQNILISMGFLRNLKLVLLINWWALLLLVYLF